MLKIDIICIARVRRGAYKELTDDYTKRLKWNLKIIELETKATNATKCRQEEAEKILKSLSSSAVIFALDERGNDLKSLNFAKTIENLTNNAENHIQFIIGGANGLTDEVRNRASSLLSFGQQTWPHLMARVMLLEQIYRAQQILSGHPYHRE